MRNNQLLTVRETAQRLRISRYLTYELVARGELPAFRLGRAIRIRRDALDSWIEASASHDTDHASSRI